MPSNPTACPGVEKELSECRQAVSNIMQDQVPSLRDIALLTEAFAALDAMMMRGAALPKDWNQHVRLGCDLTLRDRVDALMVAYDNAEAVPVHAARVLVMELRAVLADTPRRTL